MSPNPFGLSLSEPARIGPAFTKRFDGQTFDKARLCAYS